MTREFAVFYHPKENAPRLKWSSVSTRSYWSPSWGDFRGIFRSEKERLYDAHKDVIEQAKRQRDKEIEGT